MTTLLVVTSDISLGELIRQTLEETGRFNVRVAGEKKAAVDFVREANCPLVFLDVGLTEKRILEVGTLLRQVNPQIRFVIVSEAGWHPALLEELSPENYLSKPFYPPDLLKMMDKLFHDSQSSGTLSLFGETGNDVPWLSDVTRAAQHLTRLTLESSAQAALITRGDQLWAYAGQLPQSAAHELADTVSRYWDRQQESDLVRFVRLASTEAEYMLYATRLAKDMVLALIFDAETPFSTIRTDASQLVHSLSASSSEKQTSQAQIDTETPIRPAADALPGIPSPDPKVDTSVAGPQYLKEPDLAIPVEQSVSDEQAESPVSDLKTTDESPTSTSKNKLKKNEPEEVDLGETRPSPITEAARKIVLEPASPSVYNLDYACLLMPRFTHHHLTGDLSELLSDWVPQICIAFCWRLEYISVRPDYLLWIVNVPPATSPGYLMQILRRHTSENIFNEFSRFTRENPSGDFWAPGYLIMGGSQPPPAQLIKDFIAQTRQRQGILQQIR
jgi:DNA-binding response OmpR family regulator/REP element-mobilizing transposase RayT